MKILIEWYKEAHEKGFVNTIRDIPDRRTGDWTDETIEQFVQRVVTKALWDQTGHRPIVTVMEE